MAEGGVIVIERADDASASAAAPAFAVDRRDPAPCEGDWTFQRLLGPLSVEAFCRDYWGRHPLLVRGGGDDFYPSLVTLAEIERLLAIPRVLEDRMISLRNKGDSASWAPSTVGEIYHRMRRGSSLQLRKMERFLPPQAPLSALYRDLQLALQHPGVSISCFITPPRAELLGAHHDETEIFTLQVAGRKRWRLFHKVSAEARGYCAPETLDRPEREFVLGPGDLFYNPRGHVHEVVSEDELSLSIPIVVGPTTWKNLLLQLVERLGSRPEFREALPAGAILRPDAASHLAEGVAARAALIAAEAAGLDAAGLVEAAATELLAGLGTPATDHVSHSLDGERIDADTLLVTRHGDAYRVGVRDSRAVLTTGGGDVLEGPGSIAPALRAIMARRAPVAAGALHDSLSPEARLVLARRLVKFGALAPATRHPDERPTAAPP
jgi:hypothetical protein